MRYHKYIWLLLILISSSCFPQFLNEPTYSISFGAGPVVPTGDLRNGSVQRIFVTNSFDDGYALSKMDLGIGAHLSYSLSNLPLRISFGIQINSFHGDTTVTLGLLTLTDRKLELRGQIISFRAALQYALMSLDKIHLGIGIAPEMNLISGHSEVDGQKAADVEQAFRFGVSPGITLRYTINDRYFLEIPVEYHFANLLGKEYIRNYSGEIPINDDSSEIDSIEAKSITYLSILIQLGINI